MSLGSALDLAEMSASRADQHWFANTVFGSGVAKALVRWMDGGGGCKCIRLDYEWLSKEFEFTEKQLRSAVGRLIAGSHARIEESQCGGGSCTGPQLVLLTPGRLARDEAMRNFLAAKEADRAARIAARGGRVNRAPIPDVVRARVYARDDFTCQKCGATDDLTLDHIKPWSLGGPDTVENLRVLCRPCNSRKGAKA